jgi:ABC-type nitrate/sulfonate/bicarbonate transport system ATPase subunit
LQAFIAANRPRLGLVSSEVPLLSNLDVRGNIALILQYHQNLSWRESKTWVDDLLHRLGLSSIAEKRNPALTAEERFSVMLLRASMVQNVVLVLDRPFNILTHLPDGRFIMKTLSKFNDMIAEFYIFDYTWEKERYGGADDPEA